MVIVVMGVAGSGKSRIGQSLADALGWQFADADSLHPAANVEKMSHGHPLTDEDRLPWLEKVHSVMSSWIATGTGGVMACSALKQSYRDILAADSEDQVKFAYLKGSFELFQNRLNNRKNHFMKSDMLESQFKTLEAPQDALVVDAAQSPEQIIQELVTQAKALF